MGLQGRTALVLAGGGGLGRAIAESLSNEGVRVAVTGRTAAKLADTVKGLKQGLAVEWDLSDLDSIERKLAEVEAAIGPIDIIVNNTGGPPPSGAGTIDIDVWQAQFRSMVLSVMSVTARVLPGMRERGWGRVITSTSSGVESPLPNLAISNALRLALVGWSKTLSREVAKDGVTANIVVPGRIATDRIQFLDEKAAEREKKSVAEVKAASLAQIPIGRYGDVKEYADVVTFLASERASYITGSIIRVDGGLVTGI